MMDQEAYLDEVRRTCFVCDVVAGRDGGQHEIVLRTPTVIAFLDRNPVLLGHTLVAPVEHREHAVADFSIEAYLALQTSIHRVGCALQRVVPTERLYVLSLGSQQANRHVHWHVAPLPPGVPYERQQLVAMGWENGVLGTTGESQRALAQAIRDELDDPGEDGGSSETKTAHE
jgi:diadenosine tetraphosphate (Ap4A) HIT family hydrolase